MYGRQLRNTPWKYQPRHNINCMTQKEAEQANQAETMRLLLLLLLLLMMMMVVVVKVTMTTN